MTDTAVILLLLIITIINVVATINLVQLGRRVLKMEADLRHLERLRPRIRGVLP